MILFYTPKVEDIILASIVKHHNPAALLIEYADNNDIISIAKMHDDAHFIRVKDYKLAILTKYDYPAWIKNENRTRFVEIVLAHSKTTTNEVITYLAKYLFNPEQLFHSSIDKLVTFKNRALSVLNELNAFKHSAKTSHKNGLKYFEINPEHNITQLLAEDLATNSNEPVIVLNKDEAVVVKARLLGFTEDTVKLSRLEAFRIKKTEIIKPALKNIIKQTVAKKICEF